MDSKSAAAIVVAGAGFVMAHVTATRIGEQATDMLSDAMDYEELERENCKVIGKIGITGTVCSAAISTLHFADATPGTTIGEFLAFSSIAAASCLVAGPIVAIASAYTAISFFNAVLPHQSRQPKTLSDVVAH